MTRRGRYLATSVGMALLMVASLVGPASAVVGPAIGGVDGPSALVKGTGSCTGADACTGAAGPIGDNSCNGDYSCSNSTGAIGNDSCNGDLSCNQAKSVGDGSCNGQQACAFASASIGNYSCNGAYNCQNRHTAAGDCVANDSVPAECLVTDARIRRIGRHNLVGNDIYNTDATDQTLTATIEPGGKVRFSITIQDDAGGADSFTLGASCEGGLGANGNVGPALPLAFKFVTGWPAEDITSDVLAGTYVTRTVPAGGKFRLRAVIRQPLVPLGSAVAAQLSCLVTATSVGNPAKSDAVRFIVNFEAVIT